MAVLRRNELEASPLADLHAIAAELGLEGYRSLRKEDLVGAIMVAQGEEDAPAALTDDEREPDEVPAEEALEPVGVAPAGDEQEPGEDEEEPADEETSEDTSEDTSDESSSEEGAEEAEEAAPPGEEEPEVAEDEVSDEPIASGLLDVLSNGSGFLRVEGAEGPRADVYVSPAQIRRCELRAGDEVSGPVRPPRRNERHPSLIRVEQVNGADAEPPEERPWFGDLTPVFASERLSAPDGLSSVPFGKGSRVAVAGPPGAGATQQLRELARTLAERHPELGVQVVLAGVRPEELAEWRELGVPVSGGSFERPPEGQAQAAELAVERAKRRVERGGHAALVVDALDSLPPGVRRRVFGAARATEEGGTLTVVAATGDDREALRWATTRIVLEPGGRVSPESATLRADRLGSPT
jgi:transcription termination factor Rho